VDKTVKSECDSLRQLSHPNVIKIYDIEEDAKYVKKDGSSKNVTYMALELAEGGELFDYVATTGRFSEPVCRFFF
jgi:serine/threonine protein kinase